MGNNTIEHSSGHIHCQNTGVKDTLKKMYADASREDFSILIKRAADPTKGSDDSTFEVAEFKPEEKTYYINNFSAYGDDFEFSVGKTKDGKPCYVIKVKNDKVRKGFLNLGKRNLTMGDIKKTFNLADGIISSNNDMHKYVGHSDAYASVIDFDSQEVATGEEIHVPVEDMHFPLVDKLDTKEKQDEYIKELTSARVPNITGTYTYYVK